MYNVPNNVPSNINTANKRSHNKAIVDYTENVPFPPFTMTLEDHPAMLRRFRDFGAVI